ncbi:MAG: ribose 5-phosphate isomerase A [Candidatus Bathyarchaeia archaeon]
MNPKLNTVELAKKNAALAAVKHVENGFVVGLGSGSTVAYAIEEIGKRIKHEKISVLGVPTSYQALLLAAKQQIPLTTLEEHSTLDLAIDGADQIDEKLNLIKGMGGALLREKIVALASRKFIVIADESKKIKVLGENNQPVPVEVAPFALKPVMRKLEGMGAKPVLREGKGKVGPVVTDNGNFVVDAYFGLLRDPSKLEKDLKMISGVVETGLFVKMAHLVYVGSTSGVKKFERDVF